MHNLSIYIEMLDSLRSSYEKFNANGRTVHQFYNKLQTAYSRIGLIKMNLDQGTNDKVEGLFVQLRRDIMQLSALCNYLHISK